MLTSLCSDIVFINIANDTLLRHDSYLDFVRHGVEVGTVEAVGNSPPHMTSLFPDDVIPKAEEEIAHHEDKHHYGGCKKKSDRYHPYNPSAKKAPDTTQKSSQPAESEQTRLMLGLQLFSNQQRVPLLMTITVYPSGVL